MMDTQSVWAVLSSIPIGTVVAWILVVCSIIAAICTGTIKIFQLFTKYKELRDKETEREKLLQEHDNELSQINKKLDGIVASLSEQKEVNLKQIRHTIVNICNTALERQEITASMLKVLEEMFEEYQDVFHANGYVKTLVIKVRKLPVVGVLEEY